MLVEQLSTAYKCHSAIGNSIDLKEMISEVLRAFVSESYAIYGEFYLIKGDDSLEKITSIGKLKDFDASDYTNYVEKINYVETKTTNVIKMFLDHGILFLASKNKSADCSFFYSMFESLMPKLNLSIEACINYDKLLVSYDLVKKQKLELQKANKTKDEFLANMSHELKTPLNSILLISTIMSKNKEKKYDEKTIKNMNIIKKCSIELMELINDILDISQIEAGKISIHNEPMNLNTIANDLYDSMEEICLNKGIKLIKNIKGNDFSINSDIKRINQITKNLISNAIKFTSKGSVTISLEEFEDKFNLSIIDTGIGMEADNLEQIFDRFKQADGTTTRKYGGTGLGLSISKELSNLIGGNIFVKSKKGEGSTFIFEIPKKPKDVKLKSSTESLIIDIQDELKTQTPKEIFLLHSDAIEQFKLAVQLKKLNYEVISVINHDNYIKDLEKLNSEDFIAILDERLVYFDEILKKIKDYNNKNTIIITKEKEKCNYDGDYYFYFKDNNNELMSKIELLKEGK